MPINLVSGDELLPDSEGHPDGDGGDVVAGNAQHAEEDDQKLVETHSTETVRRPAKYSVTLAIYCRSYMAKYTYHHYHPKLTEELVSERHNTSIHFYSRQRGARIVKSSHFR